MRNIEEDAAVECRLEWDSKTRPTAHGSSINCIVGINFPGETDLGCNVTAEVVLLTGFIVGVP